MNKKSFGMWMHFAIRFNGEDPRIHVPKSTRVFNKSMRKFTVKMAREGFVVLKKTDWWEIGSYNIYPTKKFSETFLSKFLEVSEQIRPDFPLEEREKMLKSFSYLQNISDPAL